MKVPILLPKIFNHPFTYETNLKLRLGDYVEVPFGKTKTVGVVWDEFEKNTEKKFQTKKIIKKLKIPNLTKKMVNFINWFAEYNVIPKGMALKLSLLNNSNLDEFPKNELQNYSINLKKKIFNLTKTQKDSLKKIAKKGVERQIRGVIFGENPCPTCSLPWPVKVGEVEVGAITSAIFSPRLKSNVGLSMIDRNYWHKDQSVNVYLPNNKVMHGKVVRPPF